MREKPMYSAENVWRIATEHTSYPLLDTRRKPYNKTDNVKLGRMLQCEGRFKIPRVTKKKKNRKRRACPIF